MRIFKQIIMYMGNTPIRIVIVGFLVFLVTLCSPQETNNSISLRGADTVKLNNTILTREQILYIDNCLNNMSKRSIEVYSKPDYEVICIFHSEIIYLSIFNDEKLIYSGHYLDAWDDRMRGRKSDGFKLTKELMNFLKNC